LNEFGGIFSKMPVYSGLAIVVFFAGLGLPGLCGFIGEVLVTLSSWNYSRLLAVISAFTVILTAAYILWAIQRVYLGAEYRGPHEDALKPITPRELSIATPLVFLAILFGVAPQMLFQYVTPSVNQQVKNLANWTRDVHDGARKMIVAEGNHGLSDSEGVVTRAEITSGEIASRWAQD
jgi:NADH-quinone oxidoreductase subunit M